MITSYYFDYPPLYYLFSAAVVAARGRDLFMVVLLQNTCYLVLLLVFSYLLGREIRDRNTGIWAGIVLALYPPVYGSYRTFGLDFPLIGLAVMSVYFFVKSDCFNDRKAGILFALSCAWGMLLKESFGIFLIGPAGYGLWRAGVEVKKGNGRPLTNFIASGMILLGLIYPVYFRLGNLHRFVLDRIAGEATGLSWYDLENFKTVSIGLWQQQLTLFFFVLLLTALPFFWKRVESKYKWPFFWWLIVPNLFVCFMPHWKTARYLMPQLSALARVKRAGQKTSTTINLVAARGRHRRHTVFQYYV